MRKTPPRYGPSVPRLTPKQSRDRLDLMRGVACYAEFAWTSGEWYHAKIESALAELGAASEAASVGRDTRKYKEYLHGAVPAPKTIAPFFKAFPESRIHHWVEHPIALLLMQDDLGADEIHTFLEALPPGKERSLVWGVRPERKGRFSGRLIPPDSERIDLLAGLETPDAFLALLALLRLRHIDGNDEFDDLFEHALLDCFPAVVGGSAHLCLAKDAVSIAFMDFIYWTCGWHQQPEEVNGATLPRQLKKVWADLDAGVEVHLRRARAAGRNIPPRKLIADVSQQLAKQIAKDARAIKKSW